MSDAALLSYIGLLTVSGVFLLVVGVGGFGQRIRVRLSEGFFGIAFLGYAAYLLFFFDGGTVRIAFYVFIAPVLAVVQVVKASKARRQQAQVRWQTAYEQPAYPSQAPFAQPAYGQHYTVQPYNRAAVQPYTTPQEPPVKQPVHEPTGRHGRPAAG